jgi:Domain of unknown function (DUF4783)
MTMAQLMINLPVNKLKQMKKIFTLPLVFFGLLISSFSIAQNTSGIDDVIGALKTGNANELSKFIDDDAGLEVTLPDKSNAYSKSQAVMVLKDFFSNNGVKNFEVKFKGDKGNGQFCVGTLQTRSGNFRTHIYMKTVGDKQVIRDIKFQTVE